MIATIITASSLPAPDYNLEPEANQACCGAQHLVPESAASSFPRRTAARLSRETPLSTPAPHCAASRRVATARVLRTRPCRSGGTGQELAETAKQKEQESRRASRSPRVSPRESRRANLAPSL